MSGSTSASGRFRRRARAATVVLMRVSPSSFFTRRSWRPPAKGVMRKRSSIASASGAAVCRAPKAMTLASLCSRISRVAKRSFGTPARTPFTRLAAMAIPIPVPQQMTPRSARPFGDGLPDREAEVGVVDRIGRARAEVGHLVAQRGEVVLQLLLQGKPAWSAPRAIFTRRSYPRRSLGASEAAPRVGRDHPVVLREGVAVGHPREVVGDGAKEERLRDGSSRRSRRRAA